MQPRENESKGCVLQLRKGERRERDHAMVVNKDTPSLSDRDQESVPSRHSFAWCATPHAPPGGDMTGDMIEATLDVATEASRGPDRVVPRRPRMTTMGQLHSVTQTPIIDCSWALDMIVTTIVRSVSPSVVTLVTSHHLGRLGGEVDLQNPRPVPGSSRRER